MRRCGKARSRILIGLAALAILLIYSGGRELRRPLAGKRLSGPSARGSGFSRRNSGKTGRGPMCTAMREPGQPAWSPWPC